MSDLRKQVVEAMAQADCAWIGGASWDDCEIKETHRFKAEAALDAALDVLGDDGEGWHVEPQGGCCRSDLLAVLRAGKGSDE